MMTSNPDSPTQLLAGAAEIDISPELGIQLGGDIGRYRPAEAIQDPLHARTLVLQAGPVKVCLLSLELCSVSTEWCDRIRQAVSASLNIPGEAVMVHTLQIHSAPNIGDDMVATPEDSHIPRELGWLRGADERYYPGFMRKLESLVEQANAGLEPVRLAHTAALEGRLSFNRRFVMRDGTVTTHPRSGDPRIRYAEGPIDPEVGATLFLTEDLRVKAMLLHFTCHPTHGYPHRFVSADWPGVWAAEMRSAYPGCVPLVINGCCGNIHHNNHLDPRKVDDYHQMGRLLAEDVQEAIRRGLTFAPGSPLDFRARKVSIPLRQLSAAEIEKADRLLQEHPTPQWQDADHTQVTWDWVYALARLEHARRCQQDPLDTCEVQVLRLGDLAIVGLPGEPFVEAQLEIKLASPTYPIYVAHLTNGYAGYLPTRQALERGGYETWTATWSRFAPEALERLSAEAVEVMREVFDT